MTVVYTYVGMVRVRHRRSRHRMAAIRKSRADSCRSGSSDEAVIHEPNAGIIAERYSTSRPCWPCVIVGWAAPFHLLLPSTAQEG